MLHKAPFSRHNEELEMFRWPPGQPQSEWEGEFQLNLLTSYLCFGADGKCTITLHSVSAVGNGRWKLFRLLIWMLHMQASLLFYCSSFPLGVPCKSVIFPMLMIMGGCVQRQSFSIIRHRASTPLETEQRETGGTPRPSSIDCRLRDGTEGRDVAERSWCLFSCVLEKVRVVYTHLWFVCTLLGSVDCRGLVEDLKEWGGRRTGVTPGHKAREQAKTEDRGKLQDAMEKKKLIV